jgi:multiple sugar transport system permease protein
VTLITVISIFPIVAVIYYSFVPGAQLVSGGNSLLSSHLTLANYHFVFAGTDMLLYLGNSLIVATSAALLSVVLGAPAAYAMSRSRTRGLVIFSNGLFIAQTLPIITFLIPLFIAFRYAHLDNTLQGVVILYLAFSLPFVCWMLRTMFDAMPKELEEAAWMDGCSRLRGFASVILPGCGPGLISAWLFSFLVAWNDYLVADIFLRSNSRLTMPVGLETFFQQYSTDWGTVMAAAVLMMLPPVILFSLLQRYFNLGGVAGSLGST